MRLLESSLPLLALTSLLAACGGHAKPAESPASAAETSAATAPAAASPELAAAVAKAKACALTEDGFESSCDGYAQWGEDAPMFEDGKANPALLGMLASADPKDRLLAAEKLRVTLGDASGEAAGAEKILGAAEKEKEPAIAKALAELAAGLDLAKAGALDRAIAISKAHAVPDYAETFVFAVGHDNRDPKLLAYAKEARKADGAGLRNAALELLSALARDHADDACKEIDAMRGDADKFVAGRATSQLAKTHACAATYDGLLADLGALDTKRDLGQDVGYALDAICDDKAATPAQRTKGAAVAKRISSAPAVSANTRYYTFSAVMKCDPKGGAPFVAKFKNDKNKTLADRAKSLTGAAPKK